jgi:hypothetical protein
MFRTYPSVLKTIINKKCSAKAKLYFALKILKIAQILEKLSYFYAHEDAMLVQTFNAVPNWYWYGTTGIS